MHKYPENNLHFKVHKYPENNLHFKVHKYPENNLHFKVHKYPENNLHFKVHKHTENKLHCKVYNCKHPENTQTTPQGAQAPREHSNYTSRCTSTQKTLKLHLKVHKHPENKLHFKVYKHPENTQTTLQGAQAYRKQTTLQGVQAHREHSNYTARCTSTQKTLKLHCKVYKHPENTQTTLQGIFKHPV